MAHREFISHPLTVRQVQVLRTADVTPRMRRVTLTGAQLGSFTVDGMDRPAFASPGFDDHVKLIFASDGDIPAALPTQVPGGIEWGASRTRQGRDYTPRRVDPVNGEVDLDFVLHGDGPAAAWAHDARPGDDLWFVGPKSSTVLPEGLDWIVLAGDETALPAIGRFLDERTVHVPVYLVVAVTAEDARQDLALGPGDQIHWVQADDAAEAAGLIAPAVRNLDLPEGTGYVWAAAESRTLIPLRRYLQRELGMPKTHLDITGYWHADTPSPTGPSSTTVSAPEGTLAAETTDGTGPSAVSSGADVDPAEALEPPITWFAARAALQLGLLDIVAGHPGSSLAEIAGHLDVPKSTLAPLVAVLADAGILTSDHNGLDLGPLGEQLLVDDHLQGDLIGLDAELALSLEQLAPALRDGTAAWAHRNGRSLWNSAVSDPARYDELVHQGDVLDYLLDVFLDDPGWATVTSAVVSGPGAAAVVRALLRRPLRPTVTVHEDGVGLEILRTKLAGRDGVDFCTPVPSGGRSREQADLLIGGLALTYRTDAEATAFLHDAHRTAHTLVLLESSRPDGLDPHAREHVLMSLAGTGTAHRGRDAIGALASGTGWTLDRVLPLGWGVEALFLKPTKGSESG